ncbi:MAG: YhcH/YjgK/YiaL family protein [Candidatus Andersenbacteria bacterium]
MLFGQYNQPQSYKPLLTHPVWQEAFSWIQEHSNLPAGEHEIQGRELYANIQSLDTLPLSESSFEMHQQYIDIHYCVEGGEAIGYAPIGTLEEKEPLNTEKDYQLFHPTQQFNTCVLQPGQFAIFYPQELHMPKLQNGFDTHVSKIVIKMHKDLLQ